MNSRLGLSLEETQRRYQQRQRAASFGTPVPISRPTPVLRFEPAGVDRRPEAFGPGPCPRCQTRGTFGCAHQRPYVPPAPVQPSSDCMVYGPYSPEEDARILELLALDWAQPAIALELGRSEKSLWYRIEHLRGRGREGPRRFDAAEDARLIELRTAGLGYTEIGRAMGRHADSIHSRLKSLVANRKADRALLQIKARPRAHD